MYMHHVHARCLQRSKEGIRPGMTDDSELPCWEVNQGPPKEQQVLSTMESSRQSPAIYFFHLLSRVSLRRLPLKMSYVMLNVLQP